MARREDAMPLDQLPTHLRERIEAQASADKPPPRWLYLGGTFKPLASIESRGWYEWHWRRGRNPNSERERMPPALRQRVIERDGLVCRLCGLDVEPSDVHIDHIKPWSLGGPTVMSNLQVAHSRCNIRKGARV